MKPLVVHNLAGEPRRLNPMAIVGWNTHEHELPNARFQVGTLVVLAAGPPVAIRESQEQLDWLFQQATAQMTPEDIAAFHKATSVPEEA